LSSSLQKSNNLHVPDIRLGDGALGERFRSKELLGSSGRSLDAVVSSAVGITRRPECQTRGQSLERTT
jgi:hypothetical protein